jgi:pimeloyl-ACP methyl ester carboxylesterase
MTSKSVVFIHGMFMTPLCWEQWIQYFQTRGYTCTAPGWPGRDKPVETLRANHPDPELGKLTLVDVVEHCATHIKSLPEKPVLIGHSMGGLVVQLLLQRDIAAAGVAIHPAPPMVVFTTKWSFFKSNWPMINPLISQYRPHLMSFEEFQYAFVNTLPLADQRAAYDRYVVPESRRVPRQSLSGAARIDFSKPHPPLLLTAGSVDHIIPASLNKTNSSKYRNSSSVADYKESAGRVHFTMWQKGWEQEADYILAWLKGK